MITSIYNNCAALNLALLLAIFNFISSFVGFKTLEFKSLNIPSLFFVFSLSLKNLFTILSSKE